MELEALESWLTKELFLDLFFVWTPINRCYQDVAVSLIPSAFVLRVPERFYSVDHAIYPQWFRVFAPWSNVTMCRGFSAARKELNFSLTWRNFYGHYIQVWSFQKGPRGKGKGKKKKWWLLYNKWCFLVQVLTQSLFFFSFQGTRRTHNSLSVACPSHASVATAPFPMLLSFSSHPYSDGLIIPYCAMIQIFSQYFKLSKPMKSLSFPLQPGCSETSVTTHSTSFVFSEPAGHGLTLWAPIKAVVTPTTRTQ